MFLRDARHLDKFMYTLSNDLFYEPLETHYKPSVEYSAVITALLSDRDEDWLITRDGFWFHIHPRQATLPLQGWKVHVSATLSNAETILGKVARIAILNGIPFKFALDKNILSMMTSKKWDRGSSGKFITIYPFDTAYFTSLIERLYTELRHEEGPYILSDKRYKDCRVLYYRFGGIRRTTRVDIKGENISVLISPNGDAIPDKRTPYFAFPAWARDPFPSEDSKSESEELTLNANRYVVKRALSFSNSGGVYLAGDRTTGKEVVIKEARQHTLQDGKGNDAVKLLKKEHAILELLRDTGIAPAPLESFYDWENFFLVQEYISGIDIRQIMLGKSPLMRVNPSLAESSHFYHIFKQLFKSFAHVLNLLHERGIVLGDLSAKNCKIDPLTYAVRLIDFEGSFRLGVDDATFIYTPGFRDPMSLKGTPGFRDDLYALAAIMLYAIFPIHSLSSLRSDLYTAVLRVVLCDVGWSDTKVFDIISGLSKSEISCTQACELLDTPARLLAPAYTQTITIDACKKIEQDLGRFILANMRVSTNSLFAADPFMHRTNSLSLGFGACGVLYSLKKCGFDIPSYAYDWLERQVESVKAETLAPGLLTGSSGIAWTLHELGFEDRAVEFMKMANENPLVRNHHSYLYGMAGIGMANLYLYVRTQRPSYLTMAEDLADNLLNIAQHSEYGIFWESDGLVHVGYGYGQSGVALFFLRLFQLSGKEKFRSHGMQALEFDLSHGTEIESDVLSFPRGPTDFTFDPYLEEGSAGIAKVALRYGLWDRMEMILSEAHRKYSTFAGLLYGLGGFVDVLTDAFLLSKEMRYLEMAKRPLSGIQEIYLVQHPQGAATPGDGLLRISCDYATGVAGVLRTLHRFTCLEQADFVLDEVTGPIAPLHETAHGTKQHSAHGAQQPTA